MTLRQLRYFMKISETYSITKAAKALFISQPSLSYTIHELEEELGEKLFEKNPATNQLQLTPAGHLFYSHISPALSEVDAAIDSIAKYKEDSNNTLNVGYIHTFPLQELKELFSAYQNEPCSQGVLLKRNICTSNSLLHSQLIQGKLNFAFCLSLNEGIDGITYMGQDLYVAVAKNHKFGSRKSISFEELSGEYCVRIPHALEVNNRVDLLYAVNNVPLKVAYYAEHTNAALAYVLDANCFAIIPKTMTADTSEISFLTIENTPLTRPIFFAWKKNGAFNKLEQNFHDFVVDYKK